MYVVLTFLTQISHESTVPNRHLSSATAFFTASQLSSNHLNFTALK